MDHICNNNVNDLSWNLCDDTSWRKDMFKDMFTIFDELSYVSVHFYDDRIYT